VPKILFLSAVVLYAASWALGLAFLKSRDERLADWQWTLLGGGLLFHLADFAGALHGFWTYPENRFFFPIHSLHGALSWLAFANALIFFIVEGLTRLRILGAFVLPWTVLAMAAAALAAPQLGPLPVKLQSYWLDIHPMVLLVAYTACANAFGVGVVLLIQERQIRSRMPGELCFRLPALEDLDRLHRHLLTVSFLILSVGILMGAHWALRAWGRFWGWDVKETAAAIAWLLYAGCLAMHRWRNLRGKAMVYASTVAFAWLLFVFFGVNFISERHQFFAN